MTNHIRSLFIILFTPLLLTLPAFTGELRIVTFGPEVSLFSEEGQMYIGDLPEEFEITDAGEISVSEPRRRIELLHTKKRDFFIRGEIFLGGTFSDMRYPEDFASGFTLFVRETGGLNRYELNPVRIRNKRRVQEGEAVSGIRSVVDFGEPELEQWKSFSALVASDRIVFQIGDQTGRIPGPVDIDGRNFIGIVPGSKIRNVWLSFVEGVEEPEVPQPWELPDLRTWTDVDGRTMHGELVDWDDTSVTVRRSYDGRVFTISLETLSEEDREFMEIYGAAEPSNLVRVEGGTVELSMGTVTVDTFFIGRFEVTWAEWNEVREWAVENDYDIPARARGCADDHPVRSMSWFDALKWCNAKSEMEGFAPVYTLEGEPYRHGRRTPTRDTDADGYRLPTDREWEFAARGGNQSEGTIYAGSDDVDEVAWHLGNSGDAECDISEGRGTWPVGQKKPNELGLYDMSGNVREWCWDDVVVNWGVARRIRNGSWRRDPEISAISSRGFGNPINRYSHVGLRLARNDG